VSARAVRVVAFASLLLLSANAPGFAESASLPPAPLPSTGFVPPYEVTRIVRAAGFDPLAPPRREGTTYVLRATDYRGILMRIVVDAHSGVIRAANWIVPGPESPGMVGMAPPPYAPPPPYGPPEFMDPYEPPSAERLMPPVPPMPRAAIPPGARAAVRRAVAVNPPLPRPRPAVLAARQAAEGKGSAAKPADKAGEASAHTSEPNGAAASVAPAAAPAVPAKPPAPEPMNE